MQNQFSRTQMMLGQAAMDTLAASRVAVFGVGGVGGYAVEVLARSGVGAIDVIDNDCVSPSNINRQIIALTTNVGHYKVDVAEERIRAINPQCLVTKWRMFYLVSNADEIDLSVYDYVVDCIDTVSAKMELASACAEREYATSSASTAPKSPSSRCPTRWRPAPRPRLGPARCPSACRQATHGCPPPQG